MTSFNEKINYFDNEQIFDIANKSNDILITHSMFMSKIQSYQIYIRNIKRILKILDIKKNKEEITKTLKQKLIENNKLFLNDNNKLKKEVDYLKKIYEKKVEEENKKISGLNFYLDKLNEDKFILENTLSTKNVYIRLFNKALNQIKTNQKSLNSHERYILYSKNVGFEHQNELINIQNELAKISKEHNQEILKTERLESKIEDLRKEILESKNIIKSARNVGVKLMSDRFIFEKGIDDEEDDYNLSNLFNEFDFEYSDSFDDDSQINYDIDIDFGMENLEKKKKSKINLLLPFNNNHINSDLINDNKKLSNDINDNEICSNERKNSNENDENIENNIVKDVNIPILNLNQIEFNKCKIQYNKNIGNENEREIEIEENEDAKIEKLKKEIKKQKDKRKKYKNLIYKFEEYYKKMESMIKDKEFINNSLEKINFDTLKLNKVSKKQIIN